MKKVKIIPIKWVPEKHDTDRDGVPNWSDCNPFNPFEQGRIIDSIKNSYRQRASQWTKPDDDVVTQTPEQNASAHYRANAEQAPNVYIYAKVRSPNTNMYRWHMVGTVKFKGEQDLLETLQGIKEREDVSNVTWSDKPSMARELNIAEQKKKAHDYVERRGWKRNIQQGLKPKEQLQKERQIVGQARLQSQLSAAYPMTQRLVIEDNRNKKTLYRPPTLR